MRGAALLSGAILVMVLLCPRGEAAPRRKPPHEMRGLYPDEVYRFIPLKALGR